MKPIKNKKMRAAEKVLRYIIFIENNTIYNHAGLAIIEKDGNFYVSANEIGEVLEEYGYKLCELTSYFQCNIPLFNESGMCDLLIDIYSLDLFIVRSPKYKWGLHKIYEDKSFVESRRLPIRNKAIDFRNISEIKAMALRFSEDFYNLTLKHNNVGSHDKYSFIIYGITHYLKYFCFKKTDWTIDDLVLEIRKDLKLEADNS